MNIFLQSLYDTKQFSFYLTQVISKGGILLFNGDLGSGKTTLVREMAICFNAEDEVMSPTFSLINEYMWGDIFVKHLDLYRLQTPQEIDFLDLETIFSLPKRGGLVIIEWAERLLASQLPESYLLLTISIQDTSRKICIKAVGESYSVMTNLSKLLMDSSSGLISESKFKYR